MTIEQITFKETKFLIGEILNYHPECDFNLTPNELFGIVEETGIVLNFKPINGWDEFEHGNGILTFKEILEKVDLDLSLDSSLIVVSDECFENQKAYKMQSTDFFEFSEKEYTKLHEMDLLQPADILLIQPDTKTICMIHHNGYLMEY